MLTAAGVLAVGLSSFGLLAATSGQAQASEASKAKTTATKVVKAAKATKGSSTAKLKKIYTYISKNKSFGGTYKFASHLDLFLKYGNKRYPAGAKVFKKTNGLKKYYKAYANDMYKLKKGSCYNYSALFAVAAKKALGSKATVRIGVGSAKTTGSWNPYHSWVEVKLGGTTYVYDTQAGNLYSKSKKSATNFGKYCGTKKSKLKSLYKSFKDAKYTTVKL